MLDTTGNSKLNLLEDVLVSGSNVSGTNYIPPSVLLATKNIQDNRCLIKSKNFKYSW